MLKEMLEGKNVRSILLKDLFRTKNLTENNIVERVNVQLSEMELKVGGKKYYVNVNVEVSLSESTYPEDVKMFGQYEVEEAEVLEDDYLCIFTEEMIEVEEGEDECIADRKIIKMVIKEIEKLPEEVYTSLLELAVENL